MGFMDGLGAAAGGFSRGFNDSFNARKGRVQDAEKLALLQAQIDSSQAEKEQQQAREQATNEYLGGMMGGVPEGVNALQVAQMKKALTPVRQKANIQLVKNMDAEQGYGNYLVNFDTGAKSFIGGGKPSSPQKLTGNLGNLKAMYPDATNEELYSKALEMTKAGATTVDLGTTKKEKADLRTQVRSAEGVAYSLGKLKDAVNEHGWTAEKNPFADQEVVANLNSIYKTTLMELKELFGLGVLNGPDLVLMEQTILNPTTIPDNVAQWKGRKEQLVGSFEAVQDYLEAKSSRALDELEFTSGGGSFKDFLAERQGKKGGNNQNSGSVSQSALDLVKKYGG